MYIYLIAWNFVKFNCTMSPWKVLTVQYLKLLIWTFFQEIEQPWVIHRVQWIQIKWICRPVGIKESIFFFLSEQTMTSLVIFIIFTTFIFTKWWREVKHLFCCISDFEDMNNVGKSVVEFIDFEYLFFLFFFLFNN